MNGLLSLGLLLLAGTVRAGVGADFATPATIGGELAYNKDFMSGILRELFAPLPHPPLLAAGPCR